MLLGEDFLFIFTTFILSYLLGLPFLFLIPSTHFKNKYLIAPIFGYGLVGFLATILYKFGLNHNYLYILLWVSAFFIFTFILFYKGDFFSNLIATHLKMVAIVTLIWVSTFLLILIPYWAGGPQFSFFQGWIHDQFSYLGASLTYSNETFIQVKRASTHFFLRVPNSLFGAIELFRRPTIMHTFGVFSIVQKYEMYRFGYLFLAILVSNGILAATFLMTNIFNCSIIRSLIVAAAIFLGFWGQLYIDFNSWSMTGAMPILLVVVTYVVVATQAIHNKMFLTFRELLPLSFLIAFALYIYPESTLFQVPAILMIFVSLHFVGLKIRIQRIAFQSSMKIFLAILLGISLSAFYFKGTISHFIWAAGFSAKNLMNHAVYGTYLEPIFGQANWFQPLLTSAVDFSNNTIQKEKQSIVLLYILKKVFLEGHFELLYYGIVDGLYGFFGMYFLTPLSSVSHAIQESWRFALVIGLSLFLWFNFKLYVKAAAKYRPMFFFVGTLCAMLMIFLLSARPYAMARGLYYVAPYCVILFFIPLLLSEKIFTLRNTFLIIALLSQFLFGFARIAQSANHHNPIYSLPYTMAAPFYFAEGKTQFDWNMSQLDKTDIQNCHRVYVDIPNYWQEWGVTLYLYSKNIKFVKKMPVKSTFWDLDSVGYQKLNGKEDCTISISKKRLSNGVEFDELTFLPAAPLFHNKFSTAL